MTVETKKKEFSVFVSFASSYLSYSLYQVTVPLPSSQLSLPNFGSGGGQPLLALPPTPPQAQPPNMNRQPPVSQPYRGIMGPNHSMMQPPTSKVLWLCPCVALRGSLHQQQ